MQAIGGESNQLGVTHDRPAHRLAYYQESGTVEGELSHLCERNGRLHLVLRDELNGRRIDCRIAESDLFAAMISFRRRVAVFGRVRYRRDGHPVSVEVARIVPFPTAQDLPTIHDMRGLFK